MSTNAESLDEGSTFTESAARCVRPKCFLPRWNGCWCRYTLLAE
jgi:hypothetical protein